MREADEIDWEMTAARRGSTTVSERHRARCATFTCPGGWSIQAREDAGVTQVELAARIGRRQTFVPKYETEERRLDVAEYVAIARAIGVEPYELMRKAEQALRPV